MTSEHHKMAVRLLKGLGIEAATIVLVSSEEIPEAILYLTDKKIAHTAWIVRKDGKLCARDELGFPAFPTL